MVTICDGGFDIGDVVWDFGTYFECEQAPSKEMDGYDKLMYIFGANIELVKYQKDWYSTCRIDAFIRANLKVFDKFLNEVMQEDYTPKGFAKKWGREQLLNSEDFFDIYITPFEHLINGNFSTDDYDRFVQIIKENKPSLLKDAKEVF